MKKTRRTDDRMGETLQYLNLKSVFYCRSELTAPWGMSLPAMPGTFMFHVLLSGHAWLEDGKSRIQFRPGELILIPHGRGHRLVSEPGRKAPDLFTLPRQPIGERYEILRHGSAGGEATTLICGVVRLEHPSGQLLIDALPRVLHSRPESGAQAEWLLSSLRLMISEVEKLRLGSETVITRLADILVIQAIRAWMDQDQDQERGWLAALRDRQLGRALSEVHSRPERAWTIAALAKVAGLSRASFAARFSEVVGEPVMTYVTRWRMGIAMTHLREGAVPLNEIASGAGYESEAAFRRAFRRSVGLGVGEFRRRERAVDLGLEGAGSNIVTPRK